MQAVKTQEQANKLHNAAENTQLNTKDDIRENRTEESHYPINHNNTSTAKSTRYHPENVTSSWSSSQELNKLLRKNLRKKLSFNKVCDILEEQAIPQVDALIAHTLDPQMFYHISYQERKFVHRCTNEIRSSQLFSA